MIDITISYDKGDEDLARQLRDELEVRIMRLEVNVWMERN